MTAQDWILTERQAEILSMVARGSSRRGIAKALFLSPWTVDNVLKDVRTRLESASNAHAVARAIALEELILDHTGLVSAPSRPRG